MNCGAAFFSRDRCCCKRMFWAGLDRWTKTEAIKTALRGIQYQLLPVAGLTGHTRQAICRPF